MAMAQWRGIWRNGAPIEMPFVIRRRRMAKWRTDGIGLTSRWKRRLQVVPSVLVVFSPTAMGFGGSPHPVASPDR